MTPDERKLKLWALGVLQAAAQLPTTESLEATLRLSIAAEKINGAIEELRGVVESFD